MNKRENFFVSLFNSLLFGVIFTFAVPIFNGQGIVWGQVPVQLVANFLVGLIISLVIPSGKWGGMLAGKIAKPGSVLFKFILRSVILLIMLLFMCPIMAVLFACVMGGAPVAAVLPTSYSVYLPLYIVGVVILMLIGDYVTNLAMKCAHLGDK